ncbi:TetR/AcrR family transcriptional regulator [Pseudonocardia spirodelae]|uniref:TetR/AcrR family transcriptional regulator n=1 Tax=Pseudonocardia spirodelae TaxID=3133431 RepID=A0ABU8TCC9_9PSEU
MTALDDPRWAARPAPARRTLDRGAIVATALAVADAEGLPAVSMPRLARELGSAPMSLYRHVPGKDALVDLVLDAALGEPPDLAGCGLRLGCEIWATALRDVLDEHPWAVGLLAGARATGPAECGWAEALLAHVVGAGQPLSAAVEVLHLLHGYVRGAAAIAGDRLPTLEDLRRSGRAEALPVLGRLLGGAVVRGPGGGEPLFASGLRRTLDAVEAGLRAG